MHKKTEVGKKIISKNLFISVRIYQFIGSDQESFLSSLRPLPYSFFFLSKELDPPFVHVLFR